MSLINDALKRARQSQQNTPPSGVGPLPPIETPRRTGGGSAWVLALAGILFLAAACLFIGTAIFKRQSPPAEAAKAPVTSAPPVVTQPTAVKPATAPIPVSTPPPAPAETPTAASAATSTQTSAVPVVAAANRSPAPPVEQWPRLQGIIFNAARPLAIVNGKAVNAGDVVGNFRVKQILKNSVVFQRPDGSQKTLNLGE